MATQNFTRCDLHIPNKDWSPDTREQENYREIERWAQQLLHGGCLSSGGGITDLILVTYNGFVVPGDGNWWSPTITSTQQDGTNFDPTSVAPAIKYAKEGRYLVYGEVKFPTSSPITGNTRAMRILFGGSQTIYPGSFALANDARVPINSGAGTYFDSPQTSAVFSATGFLFGSGRLTLQASHDSGGGVNITVDAVLALVRLI